MTIKQKLYEACQTAIDERLKTIQNTIKEIQESLLSETKSSAGDKHETGRAMLQLEREKAGNQLAEIQKTKEILYKVNTDTSSKKIGLGSVVYTSKANYFIAISAGELKVDKESFYAISVSTPIGKLLVSKSENETVTFNKQAFKIIKIL